MDAGTLSVKKIFGQDRRHVVPLFQRPYVWDEQKQWQPLWDDIRSLAERLQQEETPRPHFLGAIVLDQSPKPTGHVETRLVIDGQQRLTTIQIFLEAFCDLCKQAGNEKHHKALLKLTRNDDPMSDVDDEQFKVWPTNVDQEHFRRVMQCGSADELRSLYGLRDGASAGQPIADGYLFFFDTMSKWLASDEESREEKINCLFDACRDYVRLVVIDLEKDDDAQLIFETLNARGTPLLPSDLVKNFLFHRAQASSANIEVLYSKYWKSFDEDAKYWRQELGRGHAKRHRIDLFLQHFLTLKTRDEISVAHLYIVFREYATTIGQPQSVLEDIQRYAQVYRGFDELDSQSRDGIFMEHLNAMDITTAYPLVMELFARFSKQPKILYPILDCLESFLVRRLVCQLNTRGYSRLFLDLVKIAVDATDPLDSIQSFLLASDTDSNRWPRDDEFRAAWLGEPLYRALAQRRIRFLLEAVERKTYSGKTEQIQLLEKLTIEHLMPQEWEKNWPLPDDVDVDEATLDRVRLIHTMGNLTLLNGKLNPSVSNAPWKKKKPEILKHSILKLNSQLQDYEDWDDDSIVHRGKALFKLAKSVWPFPAGK